MRQLISMCRVERQRASLGIAVALSLLAPVAAAWAADQVGIAVTVKNDVTGQIQSNLVKIDSGADVFGKEIVKTTPDSSAKIVLKDSTNMNVGPNSVVTLDNFVFNGDSDYKKATLGIAKGALRFASGQSDKRAYELKTPLATIGVRGTDYAVELVDKVVPAAGGRPPHREKVAHVEVSHGTVVVCPQNAKGDINDDVSAPDDRKKRRCGCDEVHENEAVDVTSACVYQSQFTGQSSQLACGGACDAPMSYTEASVGSTVGGSTVGGSTAAVVGVAGVAGAAAAGAAIAASNNDASARNFQRDLLLFQQTTPPRSTASGE
jgi:hypothetical protein